MNRIVGLAAALALIAPLVACTSSETPTPAESSAVAAAPSEVSSTSAAAEGAVSNDLPEGENLLFALQAASGTLEEAEGEGAFTLTLSDASDRTTWFSDRPVRDGGTIDTATLINDWAALGFEGDAPNAVLSVAGRESQPGLVIELMSPTFEDAADQLTLDVRVIGHEAVGDIPSAFGEASLFIDDASIQTSCLFRGEVDYFPFESEALPYIPADGRTLNVQAYPELFEVLGNRFGGDGDTFAVPSVPDLAPGIEARICTQGADPAFDGPDDEIDTTCSVGKVQLFAQEQPVYGYALANGQELAKTSRLFLYAGTTFGGDGVKTFATPSIPAPPGMSQQVCQSGYFQWSLYTPDQSPTTMGDVSYWATANTRAPQGWYGQGSVGIRGELMPIAQYSALFSLLGTTFGGDGKSTFALPRVESPVPGLSVKMSAFQGFFPRRG
jgi:microcystin-dependent protein